VSIFSDEPLDNISFNGYNKNIRQNVLANILLQLDPLKNDLLKPMTMFKPADPWNF